MHLSAKNKVENDIFTLFSKEMVVFRWEFSNFAFMQCTHDKQSCSHSTNGPER